MRKSIPSCSSHLVKFEMEEEAKLDKNFQLKKFLHFQSCVLEKFMQEMKMPFLEINDLKIEVYQ